MRLISFNAKKSSLIINFEIDLIVPDIIAIIPKMVVGKNIKKE